MRILLIDDDKLSFDSLQNFLSNTLGHEVTGIKSCEEALKLYKEHPFPLIISDIRMPKMDGIEFLRELNKLPDFSATEIILMTAYANINCCLEAFRLGVYDFLLKPVEIKKLAEIISRIEQTKIDSKTKKIPESNNSDLKDKDELFKQRLCELPGIGRVGFFSEEMRRNRDMALKLHNHQEIPVMIEGETGTGKEIIALLIHYGDVADKKPAKPFISLNCAAISANLFESELFGYEKGAFTGADAKGKPGKLELARGGTLFLDEIGDMPLDFQPKLLRVLQEKEYYRVGGTKKIIFDARIICASNASLKELVEMRKFRSDLYYRLNTAQFHIPPLRERKKDIIPMAKMFLNDLRKEGSRKFITISEAACKILENFSWQGNVRELHSMIERIYLQYNDVILRAVYIQEMVDEFSDVFENSFHLELPKNGVAMEEIEKRIIEKVLKMQGGNITRTAEYLRISRNRLKRLMSL
jgi:DNA-binding NtrC family response regulator